MRAHQVRDILKSIREVHQQLAARYRELDAESSDERIKLLLEDMERREDAYDACIREYESSESTAILETWLQFVPDEAVRISHIKEQLAKPCSLSELVNETLQLNSRLCDAYLTLAKEAPIPELQELFADLAQLEEENDCHYAKVLLGVDE